MFDSLCFSLTHTHGNPSCSSLLCPLHPGIIESSHDPSRPKCLVVVLDNADPFFPPIIGVILIVDVYNKNISQCVRTVT